MATITTTSQMKNTTIAGSECLVTVLATGDSYPASGDLFPNIG
jgi:hypothetical protein